MGSNVFKSRLSVSAHLLFHDIFQASCITLAKLHPCGYKIAAEKPHGKIANCYSMYHVVINL